jgi:hypothetical protein
MHSIRKRLTYANVIASVAIVLTVGGATAFAAEELPANSVGSLQLQKEAVTTTKIAHDAVTGPKVDESTLGPVPSANALAGYARKGMVRVPASTEVGDYEAGLAASPAVKLVSAGTFSIYAKCFDAEGATWGAVLIETTEDGAIFDSTEDSLTGEEGFLDTTTPEAERELGFETASDDAAEYFGTGATQFSAMAPGGTVVRGDTQIAVKRGELAAGDGIYGSGNVCLFAAETTRLGG